MFEKVRCQSCGMPLADGYYGTTADGSHSTEYCMNCFQSGTFTEPELTKEGMIQKSIDHMIKELHLSQEDATQLANMFIPKLKRWSS